MAQNQERPANGETVGERTWMTLKDLGEAVRNLPPETEILIHAGGVTQRTIPAREAFWMIAGANEVKTVGTARGRACIIICG